MYKIFISIILFIMVNSCTTVGPVKTVIINTTEKLEKIIEKSKEVIYFIRVRTKKTSIYALGTAFVIDKNGLLATAFHVINRKKPTEVEVLVQEGKSQVFKKACWIIVKKYKDLAILHIDHKFKYVAKFRNTDLVSGEFLYSVGHPDSLDILRDNKYHPSVISYGNFFKYFAYTKAPFIKNAIVQLSTIPIRGGGSGSPVFDVNGNIVGVNSAVIDKTNRIRLDNRGSPVFDVNGNIVGVGYGVIHEINDYPLTISIPIKNLTNFFSSQSF